MTGLLAEKGKTTSKRDRLLTVDVCADCFSGLGFVQIPIKQKRTRHLTMTGLLAERGGLTSLPSANTNWLSLPLKLFFLKTVHRTVFFTEKPSRVQIPPKTKKGTRHLTMTGLLAERGGFEPPVRNYRTPAFQASTLNHSDISPCV